ncbi:MAG: response regulator transcription factor [Erysipelotrichaceae bacterium]|nr:response regulator transcription factor [Erysipelotrichaceae bacterium]
MYRIAICDDDRIFVNQLNKHIDAIMNDSRLIREKDFTVEQYHEAKALQRVIEQDQNRYQLLLLDIELSNDIGMDMARAFREQQVKSSIIYITSHRDYIYDCFDTQPLWYLLKPIDYEKFKEILLSDYRKNYAGTRLVIKIEGRQLAIPLDEIYALESTQHRTRIWLKEQFLDWNGALSALKVQLPTFSFCQSHNSYIINLNHVLEILRTDVVMDNQKTFPISRRYHDQTLEKYFAYLRL